MTDPDLKAEIQARAQAFRPFWHEVGAVEAMLARIVDVTLAWEARAATCREAARRCMAAAHLADELAEENL